MTKPPAFQFYPGDRLRELMPILGDSEAVGAWCKAWMYLWGAGPSKPETVAQVAGKGWDRVGFLFREENGLLSLEWMEEKRAETVAFKERQSKNGRKGGRPKRNLDAAQNPSLSSGLTQKKPKQSPRVEGEGGVRGEVEGAEGSRQERAHEPEVIPAGCTAPMWEAIKRWGQYRREKRLTLTPSGRAAFLKKCIEWGEERAVAAIDHSILQGWTGCYEPKPNATTNGQATEDSREQRRRMVVEANAKFYRERDAAGGN